MRNTYIMFGQPKVKTPLGKPRRRWEDNITMDLQERGWEHVDWSYLVQGRHQLRALVNTVMNLRFP
jgi:hypothetical protein